MLHFHIIPDTLRTKVSEVRNICNEGILQLKKSGSRDDYKELLDLALLYLSDRSTPNGLSTGYGDPEPSTRLDG